VFEVMIKSGLKGLFIRIEFLIDPDWSHDSIVIEVMIDLDWSNDWSGLKQWLIRNRRHDLFGIECWFIWNRSDVWFVIEVMIELGLKWWLIRIEVLLDPVWSNDWIVFEDMLVCVLLLVIVISVTSSHNQLINEQMFTGTFYINWI